MRTPQIRFLGTPAAASTSVWVNPQSELIREPNLLVPKKLPIGRVKIDWNHSLTNTLLGCWLPGSSPLNMVDNGMSTIISAGGYPKINGNGAEFSRGADDRYLTNFYPGTGVMGGGNAFTAFVRFTVNTDPAGVASEVLGCNDGSNHRLYFGLDTLSVSVFGCGNRSTQLNALPRTISIGETIDLVLLRTLGSGTAKIYFGAEFLGSVGTSFSGTSSDPIYLSSEDTSTTVDNSFTVKHFYWFAEEFSVSKIRDITDDPYQFLIPA